MPIITSDDVVITIDGVDYSNFIDNYEEEGGKREWAILRTMGNNYKRISTGRTNYKVTFNFRMDEEDLSALFEITTPITIEITDDTNNQQTITYNNMLPEDMTISHEVNNLLQAEITYSAPAYDGGVDNRVVVA